jgi:excisionase family DNA binding protein
MIKKSKNSNNLLNSDLCQKLNGSELNPNSQLQFEENTHNYLTVAQVAEKLQVSKDYVRTLIKNCHLESVKLPGGSASPVRISAASLLNLLNNSKASGQSLEQDSSKRKRKQKAYYGVFSA